MGDESRPVECSVFVQAPRDRVMAYFTQPELLVRWLGDAADLDATPGGRFGVDIADDRIRGEYLVVEPDRIVFSWGFAGSPDLPPGASTVEVTFTPDADGTTVTLVHSGLPAPRAERHLPGWVHFLGRLADAAPTVAGR